VLDDLRAHQFHQIVEETRSRFLQVRIGAPLAHAVDDVRARLVLLQKRLDHRFVLLQVRVNRDDAIGMIFDAQESREQSVLRADVAHEFETFDARLAPVEFFDHCPRRIGASVVDDIDETLRVNFSGGGEMPQHFDEPLRRVADDEFFVETGHDDSEHGAGLFRRVRRRRRSSRSRHARLHARARRGRLRRRLSLTRGRTHFLCHLYVAPHR
jgi:hypothetical protein